MVYLVAAYRPFAAGNVSTRESGRTRRTRSAGRSQNGRPLTRGQRDLARIRAIPDARGRISAFYSGTRAQVRERIRLATLEQRRIDRRR